MYRLQPVPTPVWVAFNRRLDQAQVPAAERPLTISGSNATSTSLVQTVPVVTLQEAKSPLEAP